MNIYIKICTDLTVLQLIGFLKRYFIKTMDFFFFEVTIYYLVYASKQVELDTSLKWNMYQVHEHRFRFRKFFVDINFPLI